MPSKPVKKQAFLKRFALKLRNFKGWILPAVVFITGACVLVIEVIATRILAPFYGNTIFSYSSILGVVLMALSIGYYFGGRLADKRPDSKLFYAIIAAGGGAVLLMHILTVSLLPFLGNKLSITAGPPITSLALFLLPAILLGTLSPFAIKLQQAMVPDKGIGTIAGEMFFWSTLGSIAGSLITGFVLVPHFGVDYIILGVGCLLVVLGIVPIILMAGKSFRVLGSLLIVSALIFSIQAPVLGDVINGQSQANILYSKDGLYERLTIYDGKHQGRPTRYFMQDRSNSSAMYLDSDELVFDYTKYYKLYELFKPDARQALVIGGGIYSVPKALLQDRSDMQVDVSEIEPSLHDLGRQYFRVPDTPRLKTYTEDGRRLLAKSDKQYDFIFSDVYQTLFSIPSHFTTQEFFQLSHDRLNQDGIFVANIIGSLARQQPSLALSEMKTFQKAFPNSYFFATTSPGSNSVQNIMFVGIKGDKRLDLNSADISGHSDPIIAGLASKNIDPSRFDLQPYPVLSDNYAPVEHLVTPMLSNTGAQLNGQQMMELIRQQLTYGARHVGTNGHKRLTDFITAETKAIASNAQDVIVQRWQEQDGDGKTYGLNNVILRLQPDNPRRIVVGAHFDTKAVADLDRQNPTAPVPGANDAGSGVAVLLEVARSLQNSSKRNNIGVDFVFFDGEEGLPAYVADNDNWKPYGSQFFAQNLSSLYPDTKPEGGVVIDMACDRQLNIAQDSASLRHAPEQTKKFWAIGNRLASPGTFTPSNGREVLDDHTALNAAGIPSFVVIDFDYPAWHTTSDTLDKCSPQSLSTVSRTLLQYLNDLR